MKYKQQKNRMKAKKKVIIKNGFYMKYHIKVPIFTKIKTVVMKKTRVGLAPWWVQYLQLSTKDSQGSDES